MIGEAPVVADDNVARGQILGVELDSIGREDEPCPGAARCRTGLQCRQGGDDLSFGTDLDVDVGALEHPAEIGAVRHACAQAPDRRRLVAERPKQCKRKLFRLEGSFGERGNRFLDLDGVHRSFHPVRRREHDPLASPQVTSTPAICRKSFLSVPAIPASARKRSYRGGIVVRFRPSGRRVEEIPGACSRPAGMAVSIPRPASILPSSPLPISFLRPLTVVLRSPTWSVPCVPGPRDATKRTSRFRGLAHRRARAMELPTVHSTMVQGGTVDGQVDLRAFLSADNALLDAGLSRSRDERFISPLVRAFDAERPPVTVRSSGRAARDRDF